MLDEPTTSSPPSPDHLNDLFLWLLQRIPNLQTTLSGQAEACALLSSSLSVLLAKTLLQTPTDYPAQLLTCITCIDETAHDLAKAAKAAKELKPKP